MFDFVGNHVWLSVCAPIAVVEACVAPARREVPWLGRRAVVVLVVLYLVSSLMIWSESGRVLSAAQGVFVAVVAAMVWRPSPPPVWGVHPLVLGALVLGAHVAS
ncbi:hypothetical protein QLQ12_41505 [Actinoplanes sp. NEAU-A12]|uniref:Sensor histidine kinase n=1 Tax=Actinoplanes sandaracinus TaxID=3045177 RepID=A0ABT6WZQ5_9ACTN|nr:hypothetical protein [Actinoplanes sandaracinus]MDI6105081.1 hypothetical protein [Actinoplanes sandaracinus]